MRILIISSLFRNPLEKSALPHLVDLVGELSKTDSVEVVSPIPWVPRALGAGGWARWSRIPRAYEYAGVRVRYPRYLVLPRRILYLLAGPMFLLALRRAVRGEDYDVLWAHYAYPDGWAAVRLGREMRRPALVTVRGDDVRRDVDHLGVRTRVRQALREATRVTSPHPETTELARRLGASDVYTLHNGINLRRFAGGDGQRIRRELGLKDEWVVTFVGHLIEDKDPRTVVEAAARIPVSENLVFLVVGGAGRGAEQTDLRALARARGVEGRVRFLGSREDIPDILAASDCFLAINVVENIWATALLEAMAAGVPCIVTKAGTTADHLRDRGQALLIEPRSPGELASAVLELKRDATLGNSLREAGRELVQREFDLASVARSARRLLDSVASKAR